MGEINVFYGPMRNGKTKRLLEEFNEQLHTGQNVKIFKPLIDSRFSDTKVISRNGMSADAINLTSINDLANYDAEVYLIDEFQFLNGKNLVESISEQVSEDKKVDEVKSHNNEFLIDDISRTRKYNEAM